MVKRPAALHVHREHLTASARVPARQVKQVPGAKTDVADAAWLCQLAEAGLKTQIQERAREANRLHEALEDTGIKLDCIATDIAAFEKAGELLSTIPGAQRRAAESIVAEIGIDGACSRSKEALSPPFAPTTPTAAPNTHVSNPVTLEAS